MNSSLTILVNSPSIPMKEEVLEKSGMAMESGPMPIGLPAGLK